MSLVRFVFESQANLIPTIFYSHCTVSCVFGMFYPVESIYRTLWRTEINSGPTSTSRKKGEEVALGCSYEAKQNLEHLHRYNHFSFMTGKFNELFLCFLGSRICCLRWQYKLNKNGRSLSIVYLGSPAEKRICTSQRRMVAASSAVCITHAFLSKAPIYNIWK